MEFTSKEFSVISSALNGHIDHLRQQIAFSKEQLEKNKSNNDLDIMIKKIITEHEKQLEDAEMTLLKFLGVKK